VFSFDAPITSVLAKFDPLVGSFSDARELRFHLCFGLSVRAARAQSAVAPAAAVTVADIRDVSFNMSSSGPLGSAYPGTVAFAVVSLPGLPWRPQLPILVVPGTTTTVTAGTDNYDFSFSQNRLMFNRRAVAGLNPSNVTLHIVTILNK
jgi:hypothetical protein